MSGAVSGVPIAQLAVFAIFFQPSIYILFKHGKRGLLGWICVQSFCLVRIVGSVLQIIQEKNNTPPNLGTFILSSVGLSPLMLACLGILHESRRARNPKLNNKLEWFLVIQYHMLITVAMVLIIIGIVRLSNGTDLSASNSIFMKIGFAAIIVCWLILMTWTLLSLRPQFVDATTYADGTKLLYGVLIAMPLLMIRLIYGVAYEFVTDASFTTSVAAKVVLSVVPEMIAVLVLIRVGISTAHMWRINKNPTYVGVLQAQPYEGGSHVPLLDMETAQVPQKRYSPQRY